MANATAVLANFFLRAPGAGEDGGAARLRAL